MYVTFRAIGELMTPTQQATALPARGLSTGLPALDRIVGGLHPGHLAVIASRPAMGRTSTLITACHQAAVLDRVPTLAVSLEETEREFAARMLAATARVSLASIRDGRLHEVDPQRRAQATAALADAPLHVCADPWLTMADLAIQARDAVRDQGVKLIAVDGLTDIKPEKRSDLREREVGDTARDLKTLARELNVPVLATTHLNRLPEDRVGKRPRLDDLRESGAVTFAADWIVLLFRPDYYEEDSLRAGEMDLIVAKNRFGRLGCETVAAQLYCSRLTPMAVG